MLRNMSSSKSNATPIRIRLNDNNMAVFAAMRLNPRPPRTLKDAGRPCVARVLCPDRISAIVATLHQQTSLAGGATPCSGASCGGSGRQLHEPDTVVWHSCTTPFYPHAQSAHQIGPVCRCFPDETARRRQIFCPDMWATQIGRHGFRDGRSFVACGTFLPACL